MSTATDVMRVFHSSEDEDEVVGEFQVAEYIIFLLALDTYMRYAEESSGVDDIEDAIIRRGLQILRRAEADLENYGSFLEEHLSTPVQKQMLKRALSFKSFTPNGMARRALQFRTLLSRGGAQTVRAVFESNKYIRQMREAIAASMMEDADKALDIFAAMPLRNSRFRVWVDESAKQAGSGESAPQPVEAASNESSSEIRQELLVQQVQSTVAVGAEAARDAKDSRSALLEQTENEAREAAKRSIEVNQQRDEPLTRSEVVGVAAAAAMAATTDPSNPQNIPESLRALDDEQRAAALTNGRVVVAAGAGAGKSFTLVQRVTYLVKEQRVGPSRILVTTFNNKAAEELKEKIGKSLGGQVLQQMSVGTMHSLFSRFISEHGTPEERQAMQAPRFMRDGLSIAGAVQRMWSDCYGTKRPTPRMRTMLAYKSQWSGNGITPAEALATVPPRKEAQDAATWYTMYEGLKGTLPDWRPPCQSNSYTRFMSQNRGDGSRLGDFSDMLLIFRDILKRSPVVQSAVQKMFDHVIVDEAQDRNTIMAEIIEMISGHINEDSQDKSLWIVGDDKQCVHVDTLVDVPGNRRVRAGGLRVGAQVLSYRNSKVTPQIVESVTKSDWAYGFKVVTASGRSLTMSPNHRIWASEINPEIEDRIVYLMHRPNLGFRVGVTTNGRTKKGRRSIRSRMAMENADKLWILKLCGDYEEALLEESSYSLTYGIPTVVFNGVWRDLNQDRLDEVFRRFGKNGMKLLEASNLDFDHPHVTAYASGNGRVARRVIQMLAHHSKGTLVSLEWTGDDLDSPLKAAQVIFQSTGPRRRLRKHCNSYRDAISFATTLKGLTGAIINRRLSRHELEEPYQLIPAAGLFPGMRLVVLEGEDAVDSEEITSIDRVEGSFVDLSVDDASNFFGNGILSHNSINAFQGARAELFTSLWDQPGWKTRAITTNYRCEPEIVDAANALIANNEDQIPMEARADPRKVRGVGSIKVFNPPDEASAALDTVEAIKQNLALGANVTDHAILCRTNKELHAFETACIIRGVPYARKGASSFFGSPETKAVLGYVQLVTGTDPIKMQGALADAINKPNRFFIDPKKGAEAVERAIVDYARTKQQDPKTIDPVEALSDRGFVNGLARRLLDLKGGRGRDFDHKLRELGDALKEMRALAQTGGYTTRDLFDQILGLEGTAIVGGKFIEQTFRETLQADLKDRVGDETDDDEEEEDETDPTRGLGNVSFLYKLSEIDPTDEDDALTPPTTPAGFKSKMERYAARMRDLRTDVTAWYKKQSALPPEQRTPPPGTYVGTVHSVKGAQWPNTYVSMPAGKFPFNIPKRPGEPPPDPDEVKDQVEGERRLAYVALTRAAKNLTIICPGEVGGKPAGVSVFVAEAKLKVGENVVAIGTESPTAEG
jgi:superfamily I DNA/RNA helicase